MRECSYWWKPEEDEWCDLIDNLCSCGGRENECPVSSRAMDAALRGNERETLAEAARRARRARREVEAS